MAERLQLLHTRRFYPMTAFNSALGLAAKASAPTYDMLYSGEWIHPAG